MTPEPQLWCEYLDASECWRLIGSVPVGRIGVLVDSAPEIYPVNHIVDGHSVVFRTDPGNKLRGLERSPSVCYEVDGIDEDDRTGWSVLLKGRAIEITDDDELARARQLELDHWAVGEKPHWMQIIPTEVTGRWVNRGAQRSTRSPA